MKGRIQIAIRTEAGMERQVDLRDTGQLRLRDGRMIEVKIGETAN